MNGIPSTAFFAENYPAYDFASPAFIAIRLRAQLADPRDTIPAVEFAFLRFRGYFNFLNFECVELKREVLTYRTR